MAARAAEIRAALSELAAARREVRRHTPHPPRHGLALEVGAGQSPHARADVVVDKYIADNFERPHEVGVDVSKPLVVADGHRLPFAASTFAYTLALHVLEHATDPSRFAGELSRVSPAGFVQVPSRFAELTFGWPYHPWLIDLEDETLVFAPRNGQRALAGEIFHRAYAESAFLRNWWAANRSLFLHSVEWRGTLRVRVEGKSSADQTAELDVERTVFVLAELSRRGALRPLPGAVVTALRCPACGGVVSLRERDTECLSCSRAYPAVGPTPVLLVESAR